MLSLLEFLSGLADLALAVAEILAAWRFWLCLAIGALPTGLVLWLMPAHYAWMAYPSLVIGLVAGIVWEIRQKP